MWTYPSTPKTDPRIAPRSKTKMPHVNDADAERAKRPFGAKPDTVRPIRPFHGAVFTLQEWSVRRCPLNVRPSENVFFPGYIPEDVLLSRGSCASSGKRCQARGKRSSEQNDEVDGPSPDLADEPRRSSSDMTRRFGISEERKKRGRNACRQRATAASCRVTRRADQGKRAIRESSSTMAS